MLRKGREQEKSSVSFAANAAMGSVIAFGLTLVLLFIAAILVATARLPEGSMGTVTSVILFLGSLIGGIFAIRRNQKKRALLVGLAQGGILYVITLVGGTFFPGALFGSFSVFLLLSALLGGIAAGFIAARAKGRRRS